MIDHLKILSFDAELAKTLFENPLLKMFSKNEKYSNKLDQEVKNIKSTYIKAYKEILFCFFTKNGFLTKLEILIKPHYYYNNNLHNANDFRAIDCINTLTEVKDIFNLPIQDLIILNIEFGLNAISPIDCKNLISYSIYHEKNEFINSSDSLRYSKISFKHNKDGKANKYKQIKFYAKGIQFPTYADINTFRFEVKSKERKYIKTLGIYTYSDLLKIETYDKLAEVLMLEFKKVLILDYHNKGQNLTNKELLKLNEYVNTIKWIKSLNGSRNLFNKNKKDYNKLLDKTNNNIHTEMYEVVDAKLKQLLKRGAISTYKEVIKKGAISDVYIIGNCTQNQIRKCIVTGIDLKLEKGNAKYIRTATLNYLKECEKEMYLMLCSILLNNTKDQLPIFESNIINHLAKQVRNRYYNSRSIKETGYNKKIYYNQLTIEYTIPPL
jgi:hypothetical protein